MIWSYGGPLLRIIQLVPKRFCWVGIWRQSTTLSSFHWQDTFQISDMLAVNSCQLTAEFVKCRLSTCWWRLVLFGSFIFYDQYCNARKACSAAEQLNVSWVRVEYGPLNRLPLKRISWPKMALTLQYLSKSTFNTWNGWAGLRTGTDWDLRNFAQTKLCNLQCFTCCPLIPSFWDSCPLCPFWRNASNLITPSWFPCLQNSEGQIPISPRISVQFPHLFRKAASKFPWDKGWILRHR